MDWKGVGCLWHRTSPIMFSGKKKPLSWLFIHWSLFFVFNSLGPFTEVYSLYLTHWGRVRHTCVGNPTIIDSDNGMSPGRRQAIIWTNAGILLIGPLGTNFNETSIEIHAFSLKKIHLKLSSGKLRPFCIGLNVLTHWLEPDQHRFW